MHSTLIVTILTILLVLIAVGGLSIGLILTGRSKLRLGMCGRNPKKPRDEQCASHFHCPICWDDEKNQPKEEKENDERRDPDS